MLVHETPLDVIVSRPSCAVVWINGREATVARTTDEGGSSVVELSRGSEPESVFLAAVVRAIGDCQRILILGPSSTRLDLEREYVALFQRPDRLVDVEPAGPVTAAGLLERLTALSA
jgi:hypothetical protein